MIARRLDHTLQKTSTISAWHHRLEAHADEILALAKDTDLTLAELADHIRQTDGLKVAPSTIWRLLDRHGLAYKKTTQVPRS